MVLLLGSSGSPESRTQHYAVISRVWATGPRLPCANVVVCQVGMAGLEPAISCSHDHCCAAVPGGLPLPYIPLSFPVRTGGFEPPISWPPTRRDTQASLRSVPSSPYGSRTRLAALKGRCPRTDRRTGRVGAHPPRRGTSRRRALFTQWTGRCSNPRLRLFRPPLDHLSYQSNKKSPMSL